VPFSIELASLHGADANATQTKSPPVIVKWPAAVGSENPVTDREIEDAMAKWKTKFKY
jgi:hypothetical protein